MGQQFPLMMAGWTETSFSNNRKRLMLLKSEFNTSTKLCRDSEKCANVNTSIEYWVLEFCPSSGILKTREHNISGTEPLSILRRVGNTYSVGFSD
jgi:hypothetical protein